MAADRRLSASGTVQRLIERLRGTEAGEDLSRMVERARHRAAPSSWSVMFGVITIACLVVLLFSGVFLMLYFEPSNAMVEYHGSYVPLRDVEMSAAFDSTLRLSFEVRGGLLMRQAHHWAALILPASVILQMLGRFFTGDFGRRRRLSWVLLFVLFVLVLELHQKLDASERFRITPPPETARHPLRPGSEGRASRKERLRTRAARTF